MYKKIKHPVRTQKKKPKQIDLVPTKKINYERILEWLALTPLLLIAAIVPLIVYTKIIYLTPLEELNWIGQGSVQLEFFAYYKALIFVVLTGISTFFFIILCIVRKSFLTKSKYNFFIALYLVFVLLSYFLSDDKVISQRGFIDLHQGVFVLISYALVIVLMMNLVQNQKHVKAFLISFGFVGFISSFIGISQYLGYDVFQTDWGMSLILPNILEPIRNEIQVNLGTFNLYGTMGNSNYVGSFAAIMVPIGFTFYFASRKNMSIMMSLLFLLLMIFVAFGSNSRAGLLGVIISLLLSVLIFRNQIIKRPIFSILPFIVLAFSGLLLNTVSEGKLVERFNSMNLIKEIQSKSQEDERIVFKSIEVDAMTLRIETNREVLVIEKVLPTLYAYDQNGTPLVLNEQSGVFRFTDPNYQSYTLFLDSSNAYFVVRAYHTEFIAYHTIQGLKLVGQGMELVKPTDVPRIKLLDSYDSLFSHRVYIWSRSLPILSDTIFYGVGPDMYPTVFPHNDFIGKANSIGNNIIITKPHNMYIQIGINTGLLSLASLMVVFSIFLGGAIKSIWKSQFKQFNDFLCAGLFLSVLAYLITGLFNDQVVSVAPLFYIVLGLGISVNHLNTQERDDLK